MKANRNITWVAIGVAVVVFIISFILHLSNETNSITFWKGICVGIFSSSVVSIYLSITSYLNVRNTHFFKINAICSVLKLYLSCPTLSLECANEISAHQIKKLANRYSEMTEITNDFHPFFPYGFKYNQVSKIHNLVLNMSDLQRAWFHAEYYPDEYEKVILGAKKFYAEHGAELGDIVAKYEEHRK